MSEAEREEYDRVVAEVCTELDESAFKAAWAEGRAIPLDEAMAHAQAE